MKNLIFKIWTVNLLLIIGLLFLHRFFFTALKTDDGSTFDGFLNLIYLVLNMHFVLVFLCGMFICSLTFSLNQNSKIRKNLFLSLLTFIGIPAAIVLHFVIDFIIDRYSDVPFRGYQGGLTDFYVDFVAFPVFYLVAVTIEFFIFRKRAMIYAQPDSMLK